MIGGCGCEIFAEKIPPRARQSISISLPLCACVRACVCATLRWRDDSPMARVGQTNLWGQSVCPGVLSGEPAKIWKLSSHPFELQIGLLDFKKMGKAFIDVALAGRLNVA